MVLEGARYIAKKDTAYAKHFDKPGGYYQAEKDFKSLAPKHVVVKEVSAFCRRNVIIFLRW